MDDLAKLEEIIDDCIIALTSYTLDEDKITSYDEVVIDRPKLVSKTAQLITEAKIDELKHLEGGTDYWLDNGEVTTVSDRIAELKGSHD